MTLSQLEPAPLWRHFQKICSIPRLSNKEERLIVAIETFCDQQQLSHSRDQIGNLIIRKPASPGKEHVPGVVLQSHLDMVPQKNSNIQHDFEVDPIRPYVEGDWVTAEDTSLGADNGIGVAAILAVLEDKTLQHGPLEALLTINEERGMSGAFGLDASILKGDILLNLDSEDEGELYTGCAGGIDVTAKLPLRRIKTPAEHTALYLKLRGLKGGHSGVDIHRGRANANKVLVRLFKNLSRDLPLHLAAFEGGGLRNAIPREAQCQIVLPSDRVAECLEKIAAYLAILRQEIEITEPNMVLECEETECPAFIINDQDTLNFIHSVYACPNGVAQMSDRVPGVVATSNNLARVITEQDSFIIQCLTRSQMESARQDLCTAIQCTFELAGGVVEMSGAYPGWVPNPDSPMLKLLLSCYEKRFGKVPEIKVIHAGLECGIIGAIYPHWDMISFGPTIRFPHSPDEKVEISSVKKFWQFLVDVLESIPAKGIS